jgi:hypothetical protein
MPAGTARDGVTDDRAALQAMFDKIDWGSHVFIPDGHYRVNGQLWIRRRCWVTCSAGAHLDFRMSGSSNHAILWRCTNTAQPSGTLTHHLSRWEGGNISRDNNLGAGLYVDMAHEFQMEDVVFYGGSPYLWLDCSWNSTARWAAMLAITNVRGEGGGTYGIRIGSTPAGPTGEVNRAAVANLHMVGDGVNAGHGYYFIDGGSGNVYNCCFKNYKTGIGRRARARDSYIGAVRIVGANKYIDMYGNASDNSFRNCCLWGVSNVLSAVDGGKGTSFGPSGFQLVNDTTDNTEPT